MRFNSVEYFVFLAVFVALFWSLAPRRRPAVVVAGSLLFYGYRDWRLVLLLAGSIAFTYATGLALPRLEGTARRVLLGVAVTAAASVLFLFKLVDTPGVGGAVALFAPIGFTFYTFQGISYMVDVYRRDMEPERDPVLYAAYMSFFPHLLAGPIVRARRLLPQLRESRPRPKRVQFNEGLVLLFVGLFKKVAVADILLETTSGYLPQVAAEQSRLGFGAFVPMLFVGIVGTYFDIAGYIDMARGSAKLLGIEMPANFAQPLTRSRNFTDFWRRWQITLMGWLRDYVFQPLRGSTRTNGRMAVALFLTFLVAGLWHGLSVGWIAFGIGLSTILILERLVNQRRAKQRRAGTATAKRRTTASRWRSRAYVLACLMGTSVLTGLGNEVGRFASAMSAVFGNGVGVVDAGLVLMTAYAAVMLLALDNFELRQTRREGRPNPTPPARAVAYGFMLVGIIAFSGQIPRDFAYFQF